ncbi:MAG: tRNA (adenosine(37)-N6)-threonylcarbamoyltransferase complex ATPase subunit type 1 TsaE [Muribaculaceae bacterium]|nr:tRNA (adenosine(37)-N6)-threonylcarbamoyltransferase complex ATPase subunit type 1 TsaE [Muribaculaceae bacterium]
MEIIVSDLNELHQAARQLLAALPVQTRVLAFHGGMGVGKTTFVAALAEALGVTDDEVNSPTFAIVNHYEGAEDDIYHFDMYRLEDESQAFDVGAVDLLNSGSWCFVEWPENTPGILPEDTIHIYMDELADGSRKIMMP